MTLILLRLTQGVGKSGLGPVHGSCGQGGVMSYPLGQSPAGPPSLLLTDNWPKLMVWEWTLERAELKLGSDGLGWNTS